jgi:hypothetical protein
MFGFVAFLMQEKVQKSTPTRCLSKMLATPVARRFAILKKLR